MSIGPIFSYSLSSSIFLAVLYLSYKWIMAGENQHTYNRVAIWLIYLMAFLALPLAGIFAGMLQSSAVPGMLVEVDDLQIAFVRDDPQADAQPLILTAVLWIYLAGVAVIAGHTLWSAVRLWRIISRGSFERVGRYCLVITDESGIAPFSWCRYVVMSRRDWEEGGRLILIHELKHLGLHHWFDLLAAQLVCIFQWYNPAAWLMREELKAIHEYQADRAVLDAGVNARDYQMLLIKKAVGARFPSLANSLNHSKLKKRITMMYNQNSSSARRLRGLALLPALAVGLAVSNLDAVASVLDLTSSTEIVLSGRLDAETATNGSKSADTPAAIVSGTGTVAIESKISENSIESKIVTEAPAPERKTDGLNTEPKSDSKDESKALETSDGVVYTVVESKPEFPGGDAALFKYISDNIRYPQEAYEQKVQGRVVVRFVVEKDGHVGATEILRSINPELDAEAVRVIKSLPAFTPGKLNGKPVAVYYNMPIAFKLKSEKNDDGKRVRQPAFLVSDGRAMIVVDGKEVYPDVYVDGELYEGSINDLDTKTIASIDVLKDQPDKPNGVIRITLKKKEAE